MNSALTTHEKHRKEKQNGARRFVVNVEKVVMDKRGLYHLQQLLQNLTQFKSMKLPSPCQCCLKKMRLLLKRGFSCPIKYNALLLYQNAFTYYCNT